MSKFISFSYCLFLSISEFHDSYPFLSVSNPTEIHIIFILFGFVSHKLYRFCHRSHVSITLKFACFTNVFSINHSACAWLDGSSNGVHHTAS